MKSLGILYSDDIYTNMGLLVSDQCLHSIKFAIFQGTDKLVFKDRKEFKDSLFNQLKMRIKLLIFITEQKRHSVIYCVQTKETILKMPFVKHC